MFGGQNAAKIEPNAKILWHSKRNSAFSKVLLRYSGECRWCKDFTHYIWDKKCNCFEGTD